MQGPEWADMGTDGMCVRVVGVLRVCVVGILVTYSVVSIVSCA